MPISSIEPQSSDYIDRLFNNPVATSNFFSLIHQMESDFDTIRTIDIIQYGKLLEILFTLACREQLNITSNETISLLARFSIAITEMTHNNHSMDGSNGGYGSFVTEFTAVRYHPYGYHEYKMVCSMSEQYCRVASCHNRNTDRFLSHEEHLNNNLPIETFLPSTPSIPSAPRSSASRSEFDRMFLGDPTPPPPQSNPLLRDRSRPREGINRSPAPRVTPMPIEETPNYNIFSNSTKEKLMSHLGSGAANRIARQAHAYNLVAQTLLLRTDEDKKRSLTNTFILAISNLINARDSNRTNRNIVFLDTRIINPSIIDQAIADASVACGISRFRRYSDESARLGVNTSELCFETRVRDTTLSIFVRASNKDANNDNCTTFLNRLTEFVSDISFVFDKSVNAFLQITSFVHFRNLQTDPGFLLRDYFREIPIREAQPENPVLTFSVDGQITQQRLADQGIFVRPARTISPDHVTYEHATTTTRANTSGITSAGVNIEYTTPIVGSTSITYSTPSVQAEAIEPGYVRAGDWILPLDSVAQGDWILPLDSVAQPDHARRVLEEATGLLNRVGDLPPGMNESVGMEAVMEAQELAPEAPLPREESIPSPRVSETSLRDLLRMNQDISELMVEMVGEEQPLPEQPTPTTPSVEPSYYASLAQMVRQQIQNHQQQMRRQNRARRR